MGHKLIFWCEVGAQTMRSPCAAPALDTAQCPKGWKKRGDQPDFLSQDRHQPLAFTALPGKIWQGRQSPLADCTSLQL